MKKLTGWLGKRFKKFRESRRARLVLLVSLLLVFSFYFFILRGLPTPTRLAKYEIPLATQIYDRHGKLLYEVFADEKRTLVNLDQIPEYLKQATIAIEDKDFYKHFGINPTGGMLRALKNIVTKQRLEGGSTITQQLIKSALLTPERTITRKIKEVILALWAEAIYNKETILELYFNQVPYGGTAWGIDAASRRYFGKEVSQLTLAESALLAGLPQAPTRYSPFGAHPELAIARQKEVLRRMVEDGYITAEEKQAAENEELHFQSPQNDIKAAHFVMYIRDLLSEKYEEKLVEQGGLKVTTTLDLDIQEQAEKAVAEEVGKLEKHKVTNGAALVTRPATGEILAMVGSRDFFAEGFGNVNVALAHRQPGSSIKPINYAIGIENKVITPASVFADEPTCFQSVNQPLYCPQNYDGKFHGPVQTRFALGNSYNIPAVKAMYLNTVETMVASASAFGLNTINDASRYGLSLTLGGGEVTMLDMAEAFSVFANAGKRRDLVAILKVEDKNGKVLEKYEDANFVEKIDEPLSYPASILIGGEQVLSPETSYLISHMLLDNNARAAAFGTSSYLNIRGHQAVSVKTGTTDDLRDNWTIGYTPNFLVATWVGNNDNTPMNPYLVSGVSGAAPIWNRIMTAVLTKQPDLWPKVPEGIIGKSICDVSGKVPAGEGSCAARFEYFIKGTEPTEPENLRRPVVIDKETGRLAAPGKTDNIETQDRSVIFDALGKPYCLDCPPPDKPVIIK